MATNSELKTEKCCNCQRETTVTVRDLIINWDWWITSFQEFKPTYWWQCPHCRCVHRFFIMSLPYHLRFALQLAAFCALQQWAEDLEIPI